MVERTVPVGSSLKALRRLRRSGLLSRAFRAGDSDAQRSMVARRDAYLSLSVGMPWQERLALAAIGRDKYWARVRLEKARAAVQAQVQRELDQTR